MTRETLEWLRWLVAQQTVQIGAPDAAAQVAAALRALAKLDTALSGDYPNKAARATRLGRRRNVIDAI